jgi:riboflavin synthase
MFTGIIEGTGHVIEMLHGQGDSVRLTLDAGKVAEGVVIGDSVAVNGCCLTAVAIEGARLSFDLLGETVRVTSFRQVGPGSLVNLERSLAVGQRMGGHFVSGHVDGVGRIKSLVREGDDVVIRVEAPENVRRYLVYKGSVAIDGISLTVAGVDADGFHVCLIPHTLEVTNLHQRKAGEVVNLESDILARYVEGFLKGQRPAQPSV